MQARSKHGPLLAGRLLASILTVGLCVGLCGGCASVSFERDTPTSGTFESTAWAFTIMGFDFPSTALGIARGNASDGGHPNLVIEDESVQPYLGPIDWLLDILMVRRARVSGTWGHSGP